MWLKGRIQLLGPEMFVEGGGGGGLNTNYTVLSNLFGSFDFNREQIDAEINANRIQVEYKIILNLKGVYKYSIE